MERAVAWNPSAARQKNGGGCDVSHASRQAPRRALNGGGSAAAGLHLDVFKAFQGSRNTPETHVALSHVSFGAFAVTPGLLELVRTR